MASSHREGPTAARAALRCIIAYCVEFGKTWSEPSPPPAGAPPPMGETSKTDCHVGLCPPRNDRARPWLPLRGSWHGEAVTERASPKNSTGLAVPLINGQPGFFIPT